MKKTFFCTILLTVAALTATAQDTLSADVLKPSYLCPQWPDFSGECILMNTNRIGLNHIKEEGVLFEMDDGDTIMVYGFAVSAETLLPNESISSMYDTSAYEEAYELWGLYKRVGYPPYDSVQLISPQLPVNVKLDTPTYILAFSTYEDGSCTEHTRPLPVYELYFRTPQQISGSFYMCTTNRIHEMGIPYGKNYYTWPVFRRGITPSLYPQPTITRGIVFYQEYYDTGWVFMTSIQIFGFPIIAPPDSNYVWDTTVVAGDTVFASGDTILFPGGDTIVVGGDTIIIANGDTVFVAGGSAIVCDTSIVIDTVIVRDTAIVGGDTIVYFDTIIRNDTIISYSVLLPIEEASFLQRLTGVMPNPAAETAKVVSSFGMSRVEVYNLAGERVHEVRVPDGSLSATLDLRRLPAGAYLLRIHTPQGVATKKLTVRR